MILVSTLLALGAAGTFTLLAPVTYQSSTVLFVAMTGSPGGPDLKTERLKSYAALVKGRRVAAATVADLHLPLTAAEVAAKIDAQVPPGTVLLVVTATDTSPQRSRDIATVAAQQLITLVGQLDPASKGTTSPPVTISVAQDAVTVRSPSALPRNLGLAMALGLLVGVAGAVARETFYTTVLTDDDLRTCTGLETVGTLALDGNESSRAAVVSRSSEANPGEPFRELRVRLQSIRPHSGSVSFVVTSAVPREGATEIACGLAIALSETGAKVVLVDANLRVPSTASNGSKLRTVDAYLGVNSARGLTDVLAGTATVDDAIHRCGSGSLHVLPAGPAVANAGELLALPTLSRTVRSLTGDFDVVLIDAPPILAVADAAVLSTLTTGVLLVARAGQTRMQQVERAVGTIRGVGAQIVGAVLNKVPDKAWNGSWWKHSEIRSGPSRPRPPLDEIEDPVPPTDEAPDRTVARSGTGGDPAVARGRARVVRHNRDGKALRKGPGSEQL